MVSVPCPHNARRERCKQGCRIYKAAPGEKWKTSDNILWRTCPDQPHDQKGNQIGDCRHCSPHKFCVHSKKLKRCRECPGGGTDYCNCGKRKEYCTTEGCNGTGTSICEHSKIRSQCKDCTPHRFCEHGHFYEICRACKLLMCDHGTIKKFCEDCGQCAHGIKKVNCALCTPQCVEIKIKRPVKIDCIHGNKTSCVECKPRAPKKIALCKHSNNVVTCKECFEEGENPRGLCMHGIGKHSCKSCGSASFLETLCPISSKRKQYCLHCGGKPQDHRCEHDKVLKYCKECSPDKFCEAHGKMKTRCEPCGGKKQIFVYKKCKHDKEIRYCLDKSCGGGQAFCEHEKRRYLCKEGCARTGMRSRRRDV